MSKHVDFLDGVLLVLKSWYFGLVLGDSLSFFLLAFLVVNGVGWKEKERWKSLWKPHRYPPLQAVIGRQKPANFFT